MSGFQKGDIRLYQERKDKSYIVVFVCNGLSGSGTYEGIGNVMAGPNPTLASCGPSPDYLRNRCKPVEWSQLPAEWKAAVTEYMTRGGDPFDPEAEPGFWRKAPKLAWSYRRGKPGVMAPLSYSGPYVISQRPEEFTLCFRPENTHVNLGTFKDLKLAKAAAERHAERLEIELKDAWEGEGNSKRITFLLWLHAMADSTNGTLKAGAAGYLELKGKRKNKSQSA